MGREGTYITGRRVVAHFLQVETVQRRIRPRLLEKLQSIVLQTKKPQF